MDDKLPCLLCGVEIKPSNNDDVANIATTPISWENGDVAVLHCGYGSRHDLTNFVLALCDDCIDKSLQNGRIAVLNYE
jgi:hypothetical protein